MPAVVMFDGVCNLCNGIVRFISARDPRARFRFAPLESPAADTLVLVEEGRTFTRSTAALRIARRLRFPWPLAYALIIVPTPIRDALYDFVARHRYQWFGRKDDACRIDSPPTAQLR